MNPPLVGRSLFQVLGLGSIWGPGPGSREVEWHEDITSISHVSQEEMGTWQATNLSVSDLPVYFPYMP